MNTRYCWFCQEEREVAEGKCWTCCQTLGIPVLSGAAGFTSGEASGTSRGSAELQAKGAA